MPPEIPTRSFVANGPFPGATEHHGYRTAIAELERSAAARNEVVLHLQVLPGDDRPLAPLARSHAGLWPLAAPATGTAAAVGACRALGIGGFVVGWIEELDDATASVVHHLVDDGAVLLGTTAQRRPVPAPIAALVVSDLVRMVDVDDLPTDPLPVAGSVERSADDPLTPREREIVEYLEEGWRDREIADRLKLSVRTVEGHVMRARRKLGAADRSQLRR